MEVFNLGDVVVLNSHPYSNNIKSIVFSGEPQFVSPLMIVTEILAETIDKFDEKTGDEISLKGRSQCKCIWYSSKAHQFEETWIASTLLKHITFNASKNVLDEITKKKFINKLVILKTADIELAKQKSSMSIEANSTNTQRDKNTFTSLLSFVAPVMQIIQVVEAKTVEKDLAYDSKTGAKKRSAVKWLVKCKWYNPNDKLSERLLPLECLHILPEIPTEVLESIAETIENSGFYEIKNTIVQPKKLLYVNGLYYLKGFDYIKNKIIDIKIDTDVIFRSISSYYSWKEPTFEFKDGEKLPKDYFQNNLKAAITNGLKHSNFIRIYYSNRLGVSSYRTIKEYQFITIKEGEDSVGYLKGYCMTKSDIRYFKIDRISELQILNIKY